MSTNATSRNRHLLRRWLQRLAWSCGLLLALCTGEAAAEIQVNMNDDDLPQYEFASGQRLITPLGGIFRAEYRGGDRAAGQQNGFTRLGLFRPDYIGEYFFFVDGALSLTDNGAVGGNLGTGIRRMTPSGDAFWGVNAWYDNSNTYSSTVHQLGIGAEYVRDKYDLRFNAYLPMDDRHAAAGATLLSPPTFVGNRILLDTLVPMEIAMQGCDLEAGMITPPIMGIHHLRLAAGAYHYEGADTQDLNGVRGKVEGFFTPSLAAGITLQHDAVLDTSVTFQVIWTPGVDDPALGAAPFEYDAESRIAQLAKRQYQPQVAREEVPIMQLARHPDGELIFVSHADSNAPPGGDTTFEMPIDDIHLAASMAPERAIVYAHGDSVFDMQSVVLKPGQRLLGEGITHLVDTQQVGEIVLPGIDGGATPIISNSNGAAVTLANNTEVSNFFIQDAGDAALRAEEVSGRVDVNHVDIDGGFSGVSLLNSTGDFTFTDTTITDVFVDSFMIDGGAPDVLYTGDISNEMQFSGALVRIDNTTGGTIQFVDGTLYDFMGEGISSFLADSDVTIENFTSELAGFYGISLFGSSGSYTFRNTEIFRPFFTGVDLFLNEDAVIHFTDLDVTTNQGNGIDSSLNGTLIIDGESRISSANGAVMDIFDTTVDITLAEIEAENLVSYGLRLNEVRGGIVIEEGFIGDAPLDGVLATNVERLELHDLEIRNSGFSGVSIEVLGDFRSDITLDNLDIDSPFDPSEFRFIDAEGAELYLNLTNTEDNQGFLFERDPAGTIFFAGSLGQGMGFPDTNGNLQNNGNTSGGGAPNEIIVGTGNPIQIVDPSEVLLPE